MEKHGKIISSPGTNILVILLAIRKVVCNFRHGISVISQCSPEIAKDIEFVLVLICISLTG